MVAWFTVCNPDCTHIVGITRYFRQCVHCSILFCQFSGNLPCGVLERLFGLTADSIVTSNHCFGVCVSAWCALYHSFWCFAVSCRIVALPVVSLWLCLWCGSMVCIVAWFCGAFFGSFHVFVLLVISMFSFFCVFPCVFPCVACSCSPTDRTRPACPASVF